MIKQHKIQFKHLLNTKNNILNMLKNAKTYYLFKLVFKCFLGFQTTNNRQQTTNNKQQTTNNKQKTLARRTAR